MESTPTSFIDNYMKKHRVGSITNATRKNLDKLEKILDTVTKKSKNGLSFLDSIKNHGDAIGDLVERVQQHFDGFKLTWKNAFSTFHFIYNIAVEVFQILEAMKDEIVPDGLTGEKAWDAKVKFGKELIYFIWKTIGPLDKFLTWMPFRKTIEKKLVKWIAGMGLESARKMFKANKEVGSFSVNSNAVFVKAL